MAMLENEAELSLSLLNQATLAWAEMEYHHKLHSEIGTSPMERYLKGPNVGRSCPEVDVLKKAFCAQIKRTQRKSDGTFTIKGCRFEVPQRYRHFEDLCVRYAEWDLSQAMLVDPKSNTVLCTVYPQDKTANASGLRRAITGNTVAVPSVKPTGIAPLLKELMSEYAATGLPPAYLPKGDSHE